MIREIIRSGISPNSFLDQNFLIDRGIAQRIADLVNGPVVLEIGPGFGIITEYLIKHVEKIIAYEKDIRLVNYLKEKFGDNLEIIHGDFLNAGKLNFDEVVSNLPFSLATRILFKLLDYEFEKAVLGFQKEVAQKIVATNGKKYGRLSVVVQHYFEPKYFITIPRHKFYPKPGVDCGVVILLRKDVKRDHRFEIFVREIFKYANKNLNKALKLSFGIEYEDRRKPRQISSEEFYEIYLYLKDKITFSEGEH